MSSRTETLQLINTNGHNPLTAGDRSKAEQRARTRRNQQRCRERKRAHIEELEKQVDALQAKMQQCEPCTAQRLPDHETALATALRENDARRDLLSALGFDEDAQQRFIESDAKRQIVRTVLEDDDGQTTSPQTPGWSLADATIAPLPPSNLPSAIQAGVSNAVPPADLPAPSGLSSDVMNSSKSMDYEQAGPNLTVDDWLSDPRLFNDLQSSLMEIPANGSLPSEPYMNTVYDPQTAINALDLGQSETATMAIPEASNSEASDTTKRPAQPLLDKAINHCFSDTVVQVPAGDTSTACSTALSLVFRHNRKGLSIADLQQRLKPGVRYPSRAAEECRIEDSILFSVLAYIST